MARRPKPRRGVLLLIVLSLLVLFLLVGLSFMVSAGQFNRLAKSAARTETTGMPGSKLADSVLYQLLRGTTNPYSSIQGHSLLEDLYGRDFLIGQSNSTEAADFRSGHQTQIISVNNNNFALRLGHPLPHDVDSSGAPDPQELHDDYYAGCVLTFLNGNARGMSTRVLQYKPSLGYLVIQGVQAPGGSPVPTSAPDNLRFIINGRPFNGTGAGYNPTSGQLDYVPRRDLPSTAFLPHYKAYREIGDGSSDDLEQTYAYGGLDESWDSVDYQNMFLAKPVDIVKLQNAAAAIAEVEAGATVGPEVEAFLTYMRNTGGTTPSFHRPYLLANLQQNSALPTGTEKTVVFRPSKQDHPAFTGSNPDFNEIMGPWDVDCTGNGIRDSIWINAGLSPVAGPDGRMYKPLVAVHVVDLDGRLSLNAADGLERTKNRADVNNFSADISVFPTAVQFPVGSIGKDNADFGLGFGPADIAFQLSRPIGTGLIRSRYAGARRVGGDLVEVVNNSATNPWSEQSVPGLAPDTVGTPPPTMPSADDLIYDSRTGVPRMPYDYRPVTASSLDSGYGSPGDLHARSVPYLDAHGNMIWAGRWAGVLDNLDDPYEINLLDPEQHDNPFDLSDLEAIVREDDPYLQSRATDLLTLSGTFATNFGDFTTHSFSIPSAPTISPGRYRPESRVPGEGGLKRSLREMFADKVYRTRRRPNAPDDPTLNPKNNRAQLKQISFQQAATIMAPQLLRGEKLDINRVLIPNRPNTANTRPNDPVRIKILDRKQTFARHLFNLMMLLSEDAHDGILIPSTAAGVAVRRELHVRRLAQWAVNTVDFGDADSVMTQMWYDVDPFNELQPLELDEQGNLRRDTNGNPIFRGAPHSADLRSVWGMEHPEFMLTETLAFHDRRVEDDEEQGMTLEMGDPDLDSIIKPQGSAFFEIYCTRTQRPTSTAGGMNHLASRAPEDMYADQASLDLGRRIGRKPTWRLAISEITTDSEDTPLEAFMTNPDQPSFEPRRNGLPPMLDAAENQFALQTSNTDALELRRFVWFCGTPPVAAAGDNEEDIENTFYYKANANRALLVSPGSYVLVGPRPITEVGLEEGGTESTKSPQQIDIVNGIHRRVAQTNTLPLRRANQTATSPLPFSRSPFNRTVTVVAETDGGEGCNISEPLGGYGSVPSDTPLDSDDDAPLKGDQETGTRLDVRTVFLQRLADPSREWDPVLNPYRTVDWMPIDLTVFNSLHDGKGDPDDAEEGFPDDAAEQAQLFRSREKTGVTPANPLGLQPDRFNIWSAWTDLAPRFQHPERSRLVQEGKPDPSDGLPGEAIMTVDSDTDDTATRGEITRIVNTNVVHSLGYLNRSFDVGPAPNVPGDGVDHFRVAPSPANYLEAPVAILDPFTNLLTTFPTLVWHNRPYANPYELMMVPGSSSARLSAEYTVSQPAEPYRRVPGAPPQDLARYRGAFGHLLNFFHSSRGTPGENPVELGGNYHRLFDFVSVPSRFKGTQHWLNTSTLQPGNPYYINTSTPDSYIDVATNPAAIPEFREPGKVNLNTAPDSVWDQLGFDSLLKRGDTQSNVVNFELSMAGGYQRISTNGALTTLVTGRYPNGAHPAEFPNPLRAGIGADLIPRFGRGTANVPPAVDATMLRSHFPLAATNRQPTLGSALSPASKPDEIIAHTLQNRRTNAYFRFKDLMKLGNSITTQSNVYAVWITIGYFEIEPNIGPGGEAFYVDAAHPDGYQYGIELGSDIGQVRRHRAFYIVDRSIPIAFEPGVNHNVDEAILVRRHLE